MPDPLTSKGLNRVAIVEFDSQVELKQGLTTDASLLARELKGLGGGDGGAAILDTVYFSEKLLTTILAR